MSVKLRELIRSVRACKTAAEERAVVAKECALIRTSFKEEDNFYRHRNVAKLLFIHMLGYPSHFGQMECLKLIASPKFPEKRIGYLGLALLVEADSDALTLVTNSLSLDLNHSTPYVVGLALSALGNVQNKDMMRDLSTTVHKLLASTNPYIRKKAALCAVRIFKKVPDVVEDFVDRVITLLADRSHSVLLTGCTMIIDIALNHPKFKKKLRKSVPTVVKVLKNLVLSGYAPEYDVSGICDPFLHVQLLRVLRVLGRESEDATEQMNDILAQVATNTESTKNPGNAILYECVRTIMAIPAEAALRVLAINILGRFLLNRDNNIRYVALYTLGSVISVDTDAVQRHRQTIVDCLKDPDISIRARALDLIYQLVNRETVSALTQELLNYLAVAPLTHREELCSHMTDVIESFATSRRWHVDTLISMLSIAGNEAPQSVWERLITLVGQPDAEELRPYVSHKLYAAMREDKSQLGLVHVAVWTIGEMGNLLLSTPPEDSGNTHGACQPQDVIALLVSITKQHNATLMIKSMVLSAYLKLTTRLTDDASQQTLAKLIGAYRTSTVTELQARSCEFTNMMETQFDGLRGQWLAQMPVPTEEQVRERGRLGGFRGMRDVDEVSDPGYSSGGTGADEDESDSDGSSDEETPVKSKRKKDKKGVSLETGGGGGGDNLLDLDDMFGSAPASSGAAPSSSTGGDLMDIFGGGGGMQAAQPASQGVDLLGGMMGGVDLLGGGGGDLMGMSNSSAAPQAPANSTTMRAYSKAGLVIMFNLTKQNDGAVAVQALFANETNMPFDSFVFQAAVPKYVALKMGSPTGSVVPAQSNGAVSQTLWLTNSMRGTKPIRVKLKISYSVGGSAVSEMVAAPDFPLDM